MPDPNDLIVPLAKGLLACINTGLVKYGVPACRSFMAPAGPPPADECSNCGEAEGQAWVQIAQIGPTENFPNLATGPARTKPSEWAVQLNVGILRCAATVDDAGNPPSAAALTADFDKVQRDRAIVAEQVLCCFLADAEPGTWTLGVWTPLGPSGGCMGGVTQLTIAAAVCRCPDE